MDVRTKQQMRSAILSGNAILMTGAGFSRGAVDSTGQPLPLGRELAEQIWPIGFGTDPYDSESALGEIFRLALRTSGTLLREHLELVFSVDRDQLPKRYSDWFSLPWHRIYTLNIDDLDEAVANTSTLPRKLRILSSVNSTPADTRSNELTVIHLNGKLSDFPDLTFDPPSYGKRTGRQDAWYQQFVADVVTRPTFFVGTILEEPPFWHYLSLRGDKGGVNELRPRSWLFTKTIPASKRALLAEYNVELIELYESELFVQEIESNVAEYKDASAMLASSEERAGSGYIVDVQAALHSAPPGDADFLLGRDPAWGDVRKGFVADFQWDQELINELRFASEGYWIVHGDPGSGKTTSLMKAAAVLAGEGNNVLWITRETTKSPMQMAIEIAGKNADYVFVDNLERLSESAASFISNIAKRSDSIVIAGLRTGRMNGLSLRVVLPLANYKRLPDLSDPDAIQLIRKLEQGNRLGALLSLSALDRVKQITKKAGRQLLVALIEATSGRRFHEKIADECAGLDSIELACYGVICCAQAANNLYLTKDDVLLAVGAASNAGMAAVSRLTSSNTIRNIDGKLSARHAIIAESATDYFRDQGLLRNWVESLLFLFAVKYEPTNMLRGRYGLLLIRFLNHDFLRDLLGDSSSVKLLYGSVEHVLKLEFHFWLQRGSFEIEMGDLDKAETFLLHSKALRADDVLLETAWGYLRFKQALLSPHSAHSVQVADEAQRLLESVMQRSGSRSPHTYHVYLNQGVKWLQTSRLASDERRRLRDNLLYCSKAEYLFTTNTRIIDVIAEVRRKLC